MLNEHLPPAGRFCGLRAGLHSGGLHPGPALASAGFHSQLTDLSSRPVIRDNKCKQNVVIYLKWECTVQVTREIGNAPNGYETGDDVLIVLSDVLGNAGLLLFMRYCW